MVLCVCQRRRTVELRHGRCPQIVRALDNLCHFSRDFIWVLLCQRKQVRPHILVDG